MTVKKIHNINKRMEKMQEALNIFNRDLEEIKNNQTVIKKITEIKNTLEGINSRITEAEEWISELEEE